jgi:hypothetical protein
MLTLVLGTIVRLGPFTYSVAKDQFQSELQRLLQLKFSHPYLALAQVFKNAHQYSAMSDHLMSEALSNEAIIDSCIDSLLEEFAQSTDRVRIDISKSFTCFSWEIIGAITMGHRFRFSNSAEAQLLAEKIASLRIKLIRNGSFDCFYPWIVKFTAWFASPDSISDWTLWFKKTMVQGISSEKTQEQPKAGCDTKAIQDFLFCDETKSFCAKFGVHVCPRDYYHGILSIFIGTADPIAAHLRTIMAYLASCPEAQSRIREEMQARFGTETLTLGNLLQLEFQLPYLDAVLRESDRLTASDVLPLEYFAKEPVTIDGHRIPPYVSYVSKTIARLR